MSSAKWRPFGLGLNVLTALRDKKLWNGNSNPKGAIVRNAICWEARLYDILMGIHANVKVPSILLFQ